MALSLAEAFKKPKSIQQVVKQAIRPRIQGLGVIILNQTADQILVVEEKIDKNASQRGCGEISPPMETAKKGVMGIGRERQSSTLLGALSEVVDDQTLSLVQEKLRRVNIPKNLVVPLAPHVHAAIEVLIYNGAPGEETFKPTAHQETKSPHWMDMQQFLHTPHARPWGKTVVEYARRHGYLDPQALRELTTQPVLNKVRSITQSYTRRERRPDVDLVRT